MSLLLWRSESDKESTRERERDCQFPPCHDARRSSAFPHDCRNQQNQQQTMPQFQLTRLTFPVLSSTSILIVCFGFTMMLWIGKRVIYYHNGQTKYNIMGPRCLVLVSFLPRGAPQGHGWKDAPSSGLTTPGLAPGSLEAYNAWMRTSIRISTNIFSISTQLSSSTPWNCGPLTTRTMEVHITWHYNVFHPPLCHQRR